MHGHDLEQNIEMYFVCTLNIPSRHQQRSGFLVLTHVCGLCCRTRYTTQYTEVNINGSIKLRLHRRVMREACCVKRDAYCAIPHVRQNVMRDASCVKVIFAEGANQCGSPVAFLHTGEWHLICLYINVWWAKIRMTIKLNRRVCMAYLYIEIERWTHMWWIQTNKNIWGLLSSSDIISSRRHRRWAKGAMDSTSVFFWPLLLPITLWENKLG